MSHTSTSRVAMIVVGHTENPHRASAASFVSTQSTELLRASASSAVKRRLAVSVPVLSLVFTLACPLAVGCGAAAVANSPPNPSIPVGAVPSAAVAESTSPVASTASVDAPVVASGAATGPSESAEPGDDDGRSALKPADYGQDEDEKKLLAVTVEIFPKDYPLTAAILSRYITCEVLSKADVARRVAAQAQLDITAAKEKAKEAEAQAKKRTEDAKREAKTARSRLASEYQDKVVSDRFEVARIHEINRMVPLVARVEIAPFVRAESWPGYRVIPATRHLPDKATVHPFDVDATLDILLAKSDWPAIAKAWPGGCRAK